MLFFNACEKLKYGKIIVAIKRRIKMRAGIFQFMNDAVKLINSRNKFINFVAEEAKEFFSKLFETNEDVINLSLIHI